MAGEASEGGLLRRAAALFGPRATVGLTTFATVVAVGAAAWAAGQMSPQDYVKARQARYKEIGAAFKTINDQLKTDAPAMPLIATSAATLLADARLQAGMFPAGSGAEAGVKTRAKPEIWSQRADFEAANARLVTAAQGLVNASHGTDAAAVRTQAQAVGQACAACHKAFRQPES